MHHDSRALRHPTPFSLTGLAALSLSLTFCSGGTTNGSPKGDAGTNDGHAGGEGGTHPGKDAAGDDSSIDSATDAPTPPDGGTTGPGVFTWHNDNARTGQNLEEVTLTPANVNKSQFGKLFSQPVDGFVYAQPLWVPLVSIGGSKHNVAYVATENNSVYAFDADTSQKALWHVSLGTPVPAADTGDTTDLVPQLGITGTPVIDPTTNTLYVVAETKDSGGTYRHRLHALDLATGAEKFGGPVTIDPSVPGTGGNSSGGTVAFSPIDHFQRPALLLVGSVVYVPFGSNGDMDPGISHGWVVAFGASSLTQGMAYCTSPNGNMASLWSSGGGIAVDASGSLYFETGNGSFDANTGGSDYGDSVVKLSAAGKVLDYFTPYNQETLSDNDVDLASAGLVLLPDQTGPVAHELIATGKPGWLYLVDRDDMGHFNGSDNGQIVQSVEYADNTTNITGGDYATVAYFNGSIYFADAGTPGDGKLKAYSLTGGRLSTSPTSKSPTGYSYPGATPSVSANGTKNGIVWALEGQGYTPSTAPVLHAYDATDVGKELYNSDQAGSRDQPGPAVKFAVPTVANGKVYVATQTDLTVFGLLP